MTTCRWLTHDEPTRLGVGEAVWGVGSEKGWNASTRVGVARMRMRMGMLLRREGVRDGVAGMPPGSEHALCADVESLPGVGDRR